MLTIRLARTGKKNFAQFRVVVMDKRKTPTGRSLEVLGSIDPHKKQINLKKERILHWISVGAQPSDRVHNILVKEQVIQGPKRVKKIKKVEKEGEEQAPEQAAATQPAGEKVEEPKAEEPKVEEVKEEEVKEEVKAEEPKEEEPKAEEPKAEEVKEEEKTEEPATDTKQE